MRINTRSLFQLILVPVTIIGMSYQTFAENEQTNRQNATLNLLSSEQQTNIVDNGAKQIFELQNAWAIERKQKRIREFKTAWAIDGKQQLHRVPVYQAKYHDGDWNCNSNSFKNLAFAVSNLTQGKVRLTYDTIDIGTDKLFSMKPCFIYFTGNKDFAFQESEIKNLKDYLYLGGTVWIDSAYPGRNTPFDIAVRREFARVLPNRDFKQVTSNSFRNANRIYDSYFKEIRLCPGVKGSAEPIEAIKLGDELGVIYTLNGYGTMWEMFSSIDNPSKPNNAGDDSLMQEAITNSIKFGFNIVNFLFTRWSRGEYFAR